MDFVEFSKDIFSERLKEDAKRIGVDIGTLGKNAGIGNLYLYTQNNSKIPRADTLAKLAFAGIDINFLLTGKRGISVDEDTKKKIADMEERLEKLESKMFRLLEENERLKNVVDEKEKEIERLSVQSEKTLTLDVPSKLDKHKP